MGRRIVVVSGFLGAGQNRWICALVERLESRGVVAIRVPHPPSPCLCCPPPQLIVDVVKLIDGENLNASGAMGAWVIIESPFPSASTLLAALRQAVPASAGCTITSVFMQRARPQSRTRTNASAHAQTPVMPSAVGIAQNDTSLWLPPGVADIVIDGETSALRAIDTLTAHFPAHQPVPSAMRHHE